MSMFFCRPTTRTGRPSDDSWQLTARQHVGTRVTTHFYLLQGGKFHVLPAVNTQRMPCRASMGVEDLFSLKNKLSFNSSYHTRGLHNLDCVKTQQPLPDPSLCPGTILRASRPAEASFGQASGTMVGVLGMLCTGVPGFQSCSPSAFCSCFPQEVAGDSSRTCERTKLNVRLLASTWPSLGCPGRVGE